VLRVSDVWDSRENFDRFGQTLMPILQELGIGEYCRSIEPL